MDNHQKQTVESTGVAAVESSSNVPSGIDEHFATSYSNPAPAIEVITLDSDEDDEVVPNSNPEPFDQQTNYSQCNEYFSYQEREVEVVTLDDEEEKADQFGYFPQHQIREWNYCELARNMQIVGKKLGFWQEILNEIVYFVQTEHIDSQVIFLLRNNLDRMFEDCMIRYDMSFAIRLILEKMNYQRSYSIGMCNYE